MIRVACWAPGLQNVPKTPELAFSRASIQIEYVYYTYMTKKLTLTVSDEVYKGLHKRVGPRRISRFINELARERLADRSSPEYWLSAPQRELAAAYAEQAAYEAAHANETEKEDDAWLNGLIGDALRTDRSNEKG